MGMLVSARLKRLGLAAFTTFAVALSASATPPSAQKIFGDLRKATVADGINAQGFVTIGGISQWISVRGRHKDAPLLLFLHGGPGFTSIPNSYYFMAGWEEYFAVAEWDQRGAGKTFGANDPAKIPPTMTIGRMTTDAEEVVSYLRRTYHRQKIVLVAISWGTVLGTKLAQRHPDWFYVYVGISQVVDFQRSEAAGYQATLAAVRKARNQEAIAELQSIAPFPDPQHPERNFQNLRKERHWLAAFGGAIWHGTEDEYNDIGKLSPDVDERDWENRNKGMDFSLELMWAEIGRLSFWNETHFACPVLFLEGRNDLNTNAPLLGQWYDRVDAPSKKLVWFENSSHQVFEEESGKALVTLVQHVLPLTRDE